MPWCGIASLPPGNPDSRRVRLRSARLQPRPVHGRPGHVRPRRGGAARCSVALQFARDYYAEEGLEASESPIYIPPVSDLTPEAESEAQRRQSPEKHQVKGALVDLGDRRASEEAKEKYRQATGGDELPDGKTYRPPHERGSGEAA